MSNTNNKYQLFGIGYNAVDYSSATSLIIDNAQKRNSFGVSALAVHGLITSYNNLNIKELVNKIDLVVPDGQPVRWLLNSFYNVGLIDRVYGPKLTLFVLSKANKYKLNIFLYGSTSGTLEKFHSFIKNNYPQVNVCGTHVDRFREATEAEDDEDIKKINASGAHIVLVGRGCPRQEIWVANHIKKVNAVMMAVGAAFDFHAGTLKQAPKWMQDKGLEWLFRFISEPKRLWKRYFTTNSFFIYLFLKHKFILRRP
jgi:N-acetylglucosaminyldiphosphoundecaprenol N-acetyl-beta-D-mannosaminyltransferase